MFVMRFMLVGNFRAAIIQRIEKKRYILYLFCILHSVVMSDLYHRTIATHIASKWNYSIFVWYLFRGEKKHRERSILRAFKTQTLIDKLCFQHNLMDKNCYFPTVADRSLNCAITILQFIRMFVSSAWPIDWFVAILHAHVDAIV